MRKRLLGLFMALAVMLSMAPAAAFAADDAAAPKQMSSTSIGGVTYFYVNTAGDADDTAYQGTVKSRRGETNYPFTRADLTQVTGTDYWYVVVPTAQPLTGTLYGYGEGKATTYKAVYEGLGVTTDESCDVISSATQYTSHHPGDIPSNVIFGTDANGLTADQVKRIRWDGSRVAIDANGYLAPHAYGACFSIR